MIAITAEATGVADRSPGPNSRRLAAGRLIALARRAAALILAIELVLTAAGSTDLFRAPALGWILTGLAVAVLTSIVIRPAPRIPIAVVCAVLGAVQIANLNLAGSALSVSLVIGWFRLGQWMFALSPDLRSARAGIVAFSAVAFAAMSWSIVESGAELGQLRAAAVFALSGIAGGYCLAICCYVVASTAAGEDEIAGEVILAQAQRRSADSRLAKTRQIVRELHNNAVNTLRAISMGVPAAHSAELQRRCQHDLGNVDALASAEDDAPDWADETPVRVDGAEFAAWAAERAGDLNVRLQISACSGTSLLPRRVAAAVKSALTEAIVNISKHAPDATAELTVSFDRQHFLVRLTDDGQGLQANTSRGMGIENSILGQCEEQGIRAGISSSPGAGTAVEFSWEQSADGAAALASAQQLTLPPLKSGFELAVRLMSPWLLVLAASGPLSSESAPQFAARTLAWLLLAAAVLWTLRVLAEPGPRPARAAIVALALTTVAAGLMALPFGGPLADSTVAYQSGLTALATVAVITLSIRWLAVAWALYLGAVFTATTAAADVARNLGYLLALSNLIPFVAVALVTAGFTRYSRRLAAEHERLAMASLRAASSIGSDQAIKVRLKTLTPQIRALLSGIATADLSPQDPAVRRRAGEMEGLARSIIAVPPAAPESEALMLDTIRTLAEAGLRPRIGMVRTDASHVPAPIGDELETAVATVISESAHASTVTVSWLIASGHGSATLVWETPDGDQDLRELTW